jgi:hypothetical protein
MTPNGAIVFGLLVIAGSFAAGSLPTLAIVLAIALAFALAGRRSVFSALWRSSAIVLPLACFMALVWIGLIGRAPAEIAAGVPGSRATAALFVAITCLRLFIIAFIAQATALRFSGRTPLRFVRSLSAPPVVKKLLVLTLSLIETILHAIDRARTALISAGIITRQASWRNLRNGWILVQTVWLTVVTIAIGRTRDKWPVEDTLARLDGTLAEHKPTLFSVADLAWTTLAAVGLILAVGLR